MFRHTIPSFFPVVAPSLVWRLKQAEKTIYLTFDDGPHPEITLQVLNILNTYNAKATFFCVGDNVKKYPEVYHQIIKQKHAVGNHTFNHLSGFKTPNQVYFNNINQAGKVIQSKLFRPPYGQITPAQIKALKKQYTIVMWSILTRDYEPNLHVENALKQIITNTKSGDVVVFHDSEKAKVNLLYMLPKFLAHFSSLNYQFKAL